MNCTYNNFEEALLKAYRNVSDREVELFLFKEKKHHFESVLKEGKATPDAVAFLKSADSEQRGYEALVKCARLLLHCELDRFSNREQKLRASLWKKSSRPRPISDILSVG